MERHIITFILWCGQKKHFEALGYKKFSFVPFEIDIDLPKPDSLALGTYTVKTEEGKRL